MKKMYYAGIDYHKNYSTICILDADRSVVVEATVRPNTKDCQERNESGVICPV